MQIQRKEIKTAEEYLDFVRAFVTLLDAQMQKIEADLQDKEQIHGIAWQMPAIISLVNTVGYLRGQDGLFRDIRPQLLDYNELYGYEDLFETRLDKIIDIIMASPEKDYYQRRLESYLIKSRTKQEPTEW